MTPHSTRINDTNRLTRLIQLGLLVIVAVMPFHAFLSVWIGHLVGHQSLIQSWKEVMTLALSAATLWLVVREPSRLQRLRTSFVYLAGAFIAAGLIVTAFIHPNLGAVLYGLKTDFEFVLLAIIAVVVGDKALLDRSVRIIVASSVIVGILAVLLAIVLPHALLTHFGYGPNTIEPYRLIDPAIATVRTPGTLGGPNQLGSFLILPLILVLGRLCRRVRWKEIAALIAIGAGIWVSYSRSAIIGALAAIIIVATLSLRRRALLIATTITLTAIAVATAITVSTPSLYNKVQYYTLHATANTEDTDNSTVNHANALKNNLQEAKLHPWGLGLGSAGPASFQTTAPRIPENYYLQILLETGVVGLIAFLAWLGATLTGFIQRRDNRTTIAVLAAFIGLSITSLFLHTWADSSTAFVFWITAGLTLSLPRMERRHD